MIEPSTSTRPVLTVVSHADERFFPGLAVAVTSAVAAASGDLDYQFLVLDDGLDPPALAKLAAKVEQIASAKNFRATLSPLTVASSRLAALPERRGSRMADAKLVLPEILPHLESALFMEADVLLFKGLEAVRPPPNEASEYLLAGVRDYIGVIAKDCPWLDQVPENEHQLPYINCGVMWMNLEGMRRIDFTNRAITARAAVESARRGNQAVFNFLCRGNSFLLDKSLNHRTSIGHARLLCDGQLDLNLHFAGAPKPWLGPPKTSNWLAQQLWHQAATTIFPDMPLQAHPGEPLDTPVIRRKSWLYALTNPKRAENYGWDLRSLNDPGQALTHAQSHWHRVLPP